MSGSIASAGDYGQMGKLQKLAIFMVVIGPQSASVLLKYFDDMEIEMICKEISKIKLIDSEVRDKVIEEFSGIIGSSVQSILGGVDYAQKALEMSKGDMKAASIIGRLMPGNNATEILREIGDMEPMQVYNLLKGEQPQTIAFLLANLTIDKSGEILKMLEKELREQVLEYIGDMGEAPIEMLARVAQAIKPHIEKASDRSMHKPGGVRLVADLLNMLDKDIGKNLLNRLKDSNPELGAAISKRMFSFEDLLKLSTSDLQRVMREIEMSDLVISLKTASKDLDQAIMKSLSKRAAESLKDELQSLGPVKIKDIDAAQERIIQVVKRLEEEGTITLDAGGGDVVA